MIKNNKGQLIISSLIILLPAFIGILFWNELPAEMVTHWGTDGTADGWSSRAFAVFALPLFSLAAHWFCIFFTVKDPKNEGQSNKVFSMVLWICPIVSLFAGGIIYSAALGIEFNISSIGILLIGLMFAIMGNYLPKCKQNSTIGIKVKWALENEENWNATHRVCGKVWVVCGILLMLCVFLPEWIIPWIMTVDLSFIAVFSIAYSYYYHKNQIKSGTATKAPLPKSKFGNTAAYIALAIALGASVFSCILMFTGKITVKYSESSFTVSASYWNDTNVEYDSISNIEYRQNDNVGSRSFGLGSSKLLAGTFSNDEFGSYIRYSYTKCDSCVVLTVNGNILVINGTDDLSTMAIYNELCKKTAEE